MNVSEELIVAAKGGNIKDVKKLLSKGALFTKDKVNYIHTIYRPTNAIYLVVWKYRFTRGCMDGQQRHC